MRKSVPVVTPDIIALSQTARAQAAFYRLLITRPSGHDDDIEANLVDTLTDLRHLCAVTKMDFDMMLDASDRHFKSESAGIDIIESGEAFAFPSLPIPN